MPRSTPERQGVSSAGLLDFLTTADETIDSLHSFMLVRHGHVVAAGWWKPYAEELPHMLFSLSKSFTSTAVGLAVAEKKLSLDDTVLSFFPEDAPTELSANLRSMRVRDLLRMSAGHERAPSPWRDAPGSRAAAEPWTKRFLAHPVPFKPGTHFMYNTAATYMLSAIVQKATGSTLLDYLGPRLFEPLGIDHPTWVTCPRGISVGGFGLSVRTEDIARFGHLYLQKGRWQGRQLLPAAWVEEATALQTSNGSNPESDWDQGYGYQFWRCRHGAYRGDGAFGQYCIILPDQDAVVAITSGVRNMQQVLDLVWEKLLPTFSAEALPADAGALAQLEAKLAALTVPVPAGERTAGSAARVSGHWYECPENDRDIQAVALDCSGATPALLVRTSRGESRTAIGLGSWTENESGFANGLERALSVPAHPRVAASGAWTAGNVFTVRLALTETPFCSTLTLRFDSDRLTIDAEHNVAFGPTKLSRLVGVDRSEQ